MDLFAESRQKNLGRVAPLAVRMRPRDLDEFVGQQHFLGPGKLLRRMLEADRLMSVIFYGPPGTGKTSLAELIATHTKSHFEQMNAASVGVKEVRATLEAAKEKLAHGGRRTVLFLDEIHRFNRAQQDILLNDVEDGLILLIGATTENPFFAVNSALVSRSQIFQFQPLSEAEIVGLLRRAIGDADRGFGKLPIRADDAALALWATWSDGDARRALSALEVAVLSWSKMPAGRGASGTAGAPSAGAESDPVHMTDAANSAGTAGTAGAADAADAANSANSAGVADAAANGPAEPAIVISIDIAEQSMQRKAIVYDDTGDTHYDAISAMIKSIRGSDPDAAVYWVARMLEAGEDPRFIARRLAILASEDVGNADPHALPMAAACYQVTERVGMPECQLTLGQTAIYLAVAPKSNASAKAIWAAMKDVRDGRTIEVPTHLRDGHYPGSERLGHGKGYVYPHDAPQGYVEQDYLGVSKTYYEPTGRGAEREIMERLAQLRGVGRRTTGSDSAPADADANADADADAADEQASD